MASGFGFPGTFGQPGFGFRHHRHHRFFGFGLYYPWAYAYFPGSYWDYPLDYSDYQDSYNQQLQAYEQQVMSNQQQIEERLNALEDRMDQLLEQKVTRRPAQPEKQSQAAPSKPVVLVYKDGHRQEVQNYAIVGQTIWVFNEQRAQNIPASDLDLNATRKANEDRGIDFALAPSKG